ncbi:MAG TPA: hypothetical protein DCS07_11820 [Bdellovibrionales bacterium]|nr:MAG: hypothetical protein A2Z97_03520 [Bdellovibrionales bacterium GWB1_52_6]OFZ04035.1 MAG: hypothetical protein A2X97_14625 [Bdellovibrionales bacterium GWA1_52_35]OFZ35239.1 MAG: hypothetical protein A2070_04945 [Bdellovibrionales bacterium GWC1_52_8]HAR43296.1 hypothetical protein [Bdellovibrionales bacterium]HCM39880.1 hypothetical protein [Bdellovibrionales bacterium]
MVEQTSTKLREREEGKRQEEERKAEEVVKITISKDAEVNLVRILERVNDGFEAGRINRQELASWALMRFAEDCADDTIRSIRMEYFDEMAFLESILKKSKESGKLPPEIKNALKQHMGIENQAKRPVKKTLTTSYTNDVVMGNEQGQAKT